MIEEGNLLLWTCLADNIMFWESRCWRHATYVYTYHTFYLFYGRKFTQVKASDSQQVGGRYYEVATCTLIRWCNDGRYTVRSWVTIFAYQPLYGSADQVPHAEFENYLNYSRQNNQISPIIGKGSRKCCENNSVRFCIPNDFESEAKHGFFVQISASATLLQPLIHRPESGRNHISASKTIDNYT